MEPATGGPSQTMPGDGHKVGQRHTLETAHFGKAPSAAQVEHLSSCIRSGLHYL